MIRQDPTRWVGRIIAFEGIVSALKWRNREPVLRLELASAEESMQYIWACFMEGDPIGAPRDHIKVLGYVCSENEAQLVSLGIPAEEPRLLVLAAVNERRLSATFAPGSEEQFREWKSGIVPRGLQ